MGRRIYGRIYELVLEGQRADEHEYVGKVKAPTTIHERVHGRSHSAHTSAQSIAKDPWKARILPGRQGCQQLEVVYATGDAGEDDRNLRRAESYWIDRLKPTRNIVRPIRPRGGPSPARPSVRRPVRRRRWPAVRATSCMLFIGVATFLAVRLILAMQLPWPAAPWVVAPMLGLFIGYSAFVSARRAIRRVLR